MVSKHLAKGKMNAIIQVFGWYDDRYQTLRTIWMIDEFFFAFIKMYVNIVNSEKDHRGFIPSLITFSPRML